MALTRPWVQGACRSPTLLAASLLGCLMSAHAALHAEESCAHGPVLRWKLPTVKDPTCSFSALSGKSHATCVPSMCAAEGALHKPASLRRLARAGDRAPAGARRLGAS